MQTIVLVNIFVLVALTVFLAREEWKHRSLWRRIHATKIELTNIVHQLRFPLSHLRKYNDFLVTKQFGNLTLSQLEAISRAQQSVEATLSLLGRFMARSHLDKTEVSIEPALYDAGDLLAGVLRAAEPAAITRKQSLTLKKPRGGTPIFIDPIVFHGMVGELILNAVHNTPERGAIVVSLTERSAKIVVSVKDNGIGIDEGDQKRIFEKFFRTERSRSLYSGEGLGLAFVRQSVHDLGGSVTFTSMLGRGSTFSLTLPKKMPKTRS